MPTDGACGGTHGLRQRGGSINASIWDIDLIDVDVKIDQMSFFFFIFCKIYTTLSDACIFKPIRRFLPSVFKKDKNLKC